eukprot:m.24699 g.24699  ORF g.24699 m.24699 type:complete len:617 (+) comp7632_c0_seq1:401-2251(+)
MYNANDGSLNQVGLMMSSLGSASGRVEIGLDSSSSTHCEENVIEAKKYTESKTLAVKDEDDQNATSMKANSGLKASNDSNNPPDEEDDDYHSALDDDNEEDVSDTSPSSPTAFADALSGDETPNKPNDRYTATELTSNIRIRHVYKARNNKFSAGFRWKGHTRHIGSYNTKIEAAHAADDRLVELGADPSRLNFPELYPEYVNAYKSNEANKPKVTKRPSTKSAKEKQERLDETSKADAKYLNVRRLSDGKFKSQFALCGVPKFVGIFDSALEAALAADFQLVQEHADPSRLNFPEDYADYVENYGKYSDDVYGAPATEMKYNHVQQVSLTQYRACFEHNGRKVVVGVYDTELEAALAADEELVFLQANPILLNFPADYEDYVKAWKKKNRAKPGPKPKQKQNNAEKLKQNQSKTKAKRMKVVKPTSKANLRHVYKNPTGRFHSKFTFQGASLSAGAHDTEAQAGKAADDMLVSLGADPDRLNFPENYPKYVKAWNDKHGLKPPRAKQSGAPLKKTRQSQGPVMWGSKRLRHVYLYPSGRYQSQFTNNNTSVNCGSFATPLEAANAADAKLVELGADFSRLNFPENYISQSEKRERDEEDEEYDSKKAKLESDEEE